MVFCNKNAYWNHYKYAKVTILILIDGFLQYDKKLFWEVFSECHNPYFNRWFSAIIIGFKEIVDKEESQSLF